MNVKSRKKISIQIHNSQFSGHTNTITRTGVLGKETLCILGKGSPLIRNLILPHVQNHSTPPHSSCLSLPMAWRDRTTSRGIGVQNQRFWRECVGVCVCVHVWSVVPGAFGLSRCGVIGFVSMATDPRPGCVFSKVSSHKNEVHEHLPLLVQTWSSSQTSAHRSTSWILGLRGSWPRCLGIHVGFLR